MDPITKRASSIFGEIIGLVIVLFILLYLAPRLSFVASDYKVWLPIALWALALSFVFKVLKHLLFKPFSYTFEILSLILSAYSTYKLYKIFPFDFSGFEYERLDGLASFSLQMAVVAIVIAIIVNIFKIIFFPVELISKLANGRKKEKTDKK